MATEVKLPEVGEGIESGTVVSVLVKVGDTVEVDQPLIELETDKAVVEVPSTAAGTVSEIKVQENAEARIGQVIVTLEAGGAGAEAGPSPSSGAAEAGAAGAGAAEARAAEAGSAEAGSAEAGSARAETERPASEDADGGSEAPARPRVQGDAESPGAPPKTAPRAGAAPAPRPSGGPDSLVPAAPSVRRLARELGVDIREVRGSGILGRIGAADVRTRAEGAPAGAVPAPRPAELPDFSRWGEVERSPMSGIRKATVRTMANAWSTVPMVTQFDRADITEFEALRKRYKPQAEAMGAKLTPTAMLLKVVAAALRHFPDFNASIDSANNEIIHKRYVNIGVAVDTDAGLLVPVIKGADRKNMLELAKELGDLAEKARDRKLTPDDMQGGNFSVSNLGGIGGTGFTPIVNPPEVAILGVSRASLEPVYDAESGGFDARLIMPLSVSYDHRLIDGAAAARFLRWICQAIEEPFLMALEG